MDAWEFLARSEWPIVVAGAMWLLRRSIRDMFERVNPTKVDAFGFKAEFERTLDKVEALVNRPDADLSSSASVDADQITALKQAAPPARSGTNQDIKDSVIRAWARFELTFQKLVQSFPSESPETARNYLSSSLAAPVARAFGLTQEEVEGLLELRRLRNQVVHGDGAISQDDAERFERSVEVLESRLIDIARDFYGRQL